MTSSGSQGQNGPGLLTPSPGLALPRPDGLSHPHPSPPGKNLPCVQTHLAQLPAPSSHPSWGDPTHLNDFGVGERKERGVGQIRWEQQEKGKEQMTKGKEEGHRRTEPSWRQGCRGPGRAPEFEGDRKTDGAGGAARGGVGGEGVSELASFRCWVLPVCRRGSPHYANGPGGYHRGASALCPVGGSQHGFLRHKSSSGCSSCRLSQDPCPTCSQFLSLQGPSLQCCPRSLRRPGGEVEKVG